VKIKLDENLSKYRKPELIECGHDVSTALDEGLLGKSDSEVANAAKSEDRFVFTLDHGFADIRKFPPGGHPGVVLFRPKSMGPNAVNEFVVRFVKNANLSELVGCVVVVDPDRVHVRRFHVV
jgi:predicted nuclease of predicted toxin-antitoxin system